MEKRFVLLMAFFSILLVSLVLFKVFFSSSKKDINLVSYDTTNKTDSESGYIKLPSGSSGMTKYTGKVVPSGASSYELIDADGKLVVGLTADDAKLTLAEGRYVEVTGVLQKNATGESVLKVEAVAFR
ncbi:MAG: hypothetical protein ABIJ36_02815 [Patescibacteria group bacterium]|nr:hypothetical protein [Patescibacteria group bacterium]